MTPLYSVLESEHSSLKIFRELFVRCIVCDASISSRTSTLGSCTVPGRKFAKELSSFSDNKSQWFCFQNHRFLVIKFTE